VILKTEDCGDTWKHVSLDFDPDLSRSEIINGTVFLVGDLGEAFKFQNSIITDFQLFELSQANLNFGQVQINDTVVESVKVFNPGSTALNVLSAISDQAEFTVSPADTAIAAGDSATFLLTFTPAATAQLAIMLLRR